MKKNFIQRMKQGAAVTSLGLAGLLFDGCAIPQQGWNTMADIATNAVAAGAAKAAVNEVNQAYGVQEGTQVNVYGKGGQQNQNVSRLPPVFSCSYFKDFNGNGRIDEQEFMGVGTDATKKLREGFIIVFLPRINRSSTIHVKMFNSARDIVYQNVKNLSAYDVMPLDYTNNHPPLGEYVFTAEVDGQFLGMTKVKIVE